MNPSAANVTGHTPRFRSMPLIGTKSVTFAAAAALLSILAGCSSSHPTAAASGSDGVQAVTFRTTDDFRFVPATASVRTGKVRITLMDVGAYPHNISFPALHTTSASVSGSPGQTSTSLLLTFATPGRYSFVCTYHSTAGMKGQLVVLKRP
jgi:plastocyanin